MAHAGRSLYKLRKIPKLPSVKILRQKLRQFRSKVVLRCIHEILTMEVIELLCCLAVLATFTSGVRIRCEYQMGDWNVLGRLYTCRGSVISDENPTIVTDVIGTHLAGDENSDVKGFWVLDGHESLTTIPKGLENFFANLQGFQWAYGNISSIDSSTFEPFSNLLRIGLQSNELVTLDGDLLQHTRKLHWISFSFNLLQHVGHDFLAGLTDLTYAYFQSNPCIHSEANTTQGVQDLNRLLPELCPPLATSLDPPTTTVSTTPEPNVCPVRCTINEEVDEINNRIEGVELQMRDEMMNRMEEIERQLRELNSSPCSCY